MFILALFAISAFFLALFAVGVWRDRRRLINAVYLFLALATGGLFLLIVAGYVVGGPVILAVILSFYAALVFLAFFLVWNGVTMLRREGRRPANLLSLGAGLGMFAYPVLSVLVIRAHVHWLNIAFAMTALPLAYVVFLFACFVLYSLVYGLIPYRGTPDFVIVLGSGLIGGDRVPPLLASRLDRARAAAEAAAAQGGRPTLITSGGQGPGETVPEGRAMADYLLARGVPEELIEVEDESRTTSENLRFSATIMDRLRPGGSCLVVTNNFHVMRAAHLTRRLKLNAQVIGSRTALYFWPSAIIREFAGVFLSYRVTNAVVCCLLLLLPPLGGLS